jgi:hypothetical protein
MFELRTLEPLPDGQQIVDRNQSLFDKSKKSLSHVTKIGFYSIFEGREPSVIRWFVVDQDDKVVGLFKFTQLTIIDTKYWVASYVWVSSENRGHGIAKAVYTLFVHQYGEVVSDYEQTVDSKRIWKSLFNSFNCYGLFWNKHEEQEWGKIDSPEELERR